MKNDDEIQRKPVVLARTGFANSTLYLYIKKGLFPKQKKLGARSVGWLKSDVDNWIASRDEV